MSAILIYITTPNRDEAEAIARAVVEDRLAACANILPQMTSIYHWEGEVRTEEECVLILKTRATLFPAVEVLVRGIHSFKNPSIIGLPIGTASKSFLDWIMAETKP